MTSELPAGYRPMHLSSFRGIFKKIWEKETPAILHLYYKVVKLIMPWGKHTMPRYLEGLEFRVSVIANDV